jgi:hypothetical protein
VLHTTKNSVCTARCRSAAATAPGRLLRCVRVLIPAVPRPACGHAATGSGAPARRQAPSRGRWGVGARSITARAIQSYAGEREDVLLWGRPSACALHQQAVLTRARCTRRCERPVSRSPYAAAGDAGARAAAAEGAAGRGRSCWSRCSRRRPISGRPTCQPGRQRRFRRPWSRKARRTIASRQVRSSSVSATHAWCAGRRGPCSAFGRSRGGRAGGRSAGCGYGPLLSGGGGRPCAGRSQDVRCVSTRVSNPRMCVEGVRTHEGCARNQRRGSALARVGRHALPPLGGVPLRPTGRLTHMALVAAMPGLDVSCAWAEVRCLA